MISNISSTKKVNHQAIIISITSHHITKRHKILRGNLYRRKPQFFFLFIFNSLHRFIGYDLQEETTPNKCRMPLVIGYNLIEARTSK